MIKKFFAKLYYFIIMKLRFVRNNISAMEKVYIARSFKNFDKAKIIIGKNSRIKTGCCVRGKGTLVIGDNVQINDFCYFNLFSETKIVIGDNCNIGQYSYFVNFDHSTSQTTNADNADDIILGSNVWVGAKAVILKGSKIGDNSIIGAGCVYKKKDVSTNNIYIGNPATLLRKKDE